MAKTSKPISTISYNSIDFLKNTLLRLLYLKKIQYYEFIVHLPDVDDKKKHIHLYVMPNTNLDLVEFGSWFEEPDINNDKPLKCMPFRISSNFGDWYWYSIHDKDYLKAKHLERHTFYNDNDIYSSDIDFHRTLVQECPLINYAKMSDMALRDYVCQCVYNGVSLGKLLSSEKVPLGKTQSVVSLFRALDEFINYKSMSRYNKENKIKYKEVECEQLPFPVDDLYD